MLISKLKEKQIGDDTVPGILAFPFFTIHCFSHKKAPGLHPVTATAAEPQKKHFLLF